MGVFSLQFIGLFKSRIGFERELCVFATCHCVFKGLFEFFGGPLIDFQWRARYFVIQDRFSKKTVVFLVANFVFQSEYWFFGFRHFVRRCCGRFFIGNL